MKLKLEQIKRNNLTKVKVYDILREKVFTVERRIVCKKVEMLILNEVWTQVCGKILLSIRYYKIL